jgi:hypothetical protein
MRVIKRNNKLVESIDIKAQVQEIKNSYPDATTEELISRTISTLKKANPEIKITGVEALDIAREIYEFKNDIDVVNFFEKRKIKERIKVYDKSQDFSKIPDEIKTLISSLSDADKENLITRLQK